MKKRRCYLCGGKLVNGRCTLCGLDNTKIERKNYRLNESSFDGKGIEAKHLCESHNGKPSGGLNRQGQASWQSGRNQQGQSSWQNGQNQQGQSSWQRPAISFVTTEIKNKIDQINNSGDDNWWSGSEIDTSVDENDPYEFVTRELSDSGEVYDTELGYGEYVVGTDIPEGTYEVTLPFICMDISLKMHLMRMKILLKWKM